MIAPGPIVTSWPKEFLRQPGIEPGSIAWEATMLTITPLTQRDIELHALSIDDVAFKMVKFDFSHFQRPYQLSRNAPSQQRRWCKG